MSRAVAGPTSVSPPAPICVAPRRWLSLSGMLTTAPAVTLDCRTLRRLAATLSTHLAVPLLSLLPLRQHRASVLDSCPAPHQRASNTVGLFPCMQQSGFLHFMFQPPSSLVLIHLHLHRSSRISTQYAISHTPASQTDPAERSHLQLLNRCQQHCLDRPRTFARYDECHLCSMSHQGA